MKSLNQLFNSGTSEGAKKAAETRKSHGLPGHENDQAQHAVEGATKAAKQGKTKIAVYHDPYSDGEDSHYGSYGFAPHAGMKILAPHAKLLATVHPTGKIESHVSNRGTPLCELFANAGTSEGVKKAWETRNGLKGGAEAAQSSGAAVHATSIAESYKGKPEEADKHDLANHLHSVAAETHEDIIKDHQNGNPKYSHAGLSWQAKWHRGQAVKHANAAHTLRTGKDYRNLDDFSEQHKKLYPESKRSEVEAAHKNYLSHIGE